MLNQGITNYINSIDLEWQREVLEKIRKTIHLVDPEIEEDVKWGSPAFNHNGPVLWVFTADNWVHLSFPHGALLNNDHGLFEKTDNAGQRTIKIYKQQEFPEEILVTLLSEAVKNNLEGKRVSFNRTRPEPKTFNLNKKYKKLLIEKKLLNEFTKRPYYQQSGWIRWIESAKKPKTQDRRKEQMLEELTAGNTYMKMQWK